MLVLSFYEIPQLSRTRSIISFVSVEFPIQMSPWRADRECSLLDSSTDKAFYQLPKPRNASLDATRESLPVDLTLLQGELLTMLQEAS